MTGADRTIPAALAALDGQPRVRDLLAASVVEGKVAHAYLFVGAPGSGKLDAALALAECIICPEGGDGSCDECIRVRHRTHPDVHWLAPESANGYLIDQIRGLIDDVSLTPSRAASKVYVLDRVDLLRGAAANALLKTIEEPPANTVFILCGRSIQAILPTIASRCQVVPFRVVPEDAALEALKRRVACTDEEARIALAVAGSPSRGEEYLRSVSRTATRDLVVRTIGELANDDAWDVLVSARAIVSSVSEQLEDAKAVQEAALGESAEFLSSSAMKKLEEAGKRALSARQRSGMMEVLAAASSLLRDALVACEGVGEGIVNADAAATVERIARMSSASGIMSALGKVQEADEDLARNVSPQLACEVMLLGIKEALSCR